MVDEIAKETEKHKHYKSKLYLTLEAISKSSEFFEVCEHIDDRKVGLSPVFASEAYFGLQVIVHVAL